MMVGQNTGSDVTKNKIPEGSVGVEIGVWRGDTTAKFIKRAKHIVAVDPWSLKGNEDPELFFERYSELVGDTSKEAFTDYYNDVHKFVCKRFKDHNITICRMTSREWFKQNKETYDWVYVDGLHNHDGCLYDLRESWKIIKEGGTLFGDDYPNKEGVVSAVNQFINETGLKLEKFSHNQYLIRK